MRKLVFALSLLACGSARGQDWWQQVQQYDELRSQRYYAPQQSYTPSRAGDMQQPLQRPPGVARYAGPPRATLYNYNVGANYYRGPGGEILRADQLPRNANMNGYRYLGSYSTARPYRPR